MTVQPATADRDEPGAAVDDQPGDAGDRRQRSEDQGDRTTRGEADGVGTESGGAVRVDGYFEGELHIGGDLIVGETGKIIGTIVAKNVIIAGEVRGTIEARGKLELAPTAKVFGDSKMVTLVVEDGAFIQGMCAPLPRGDLKERGKALFVTTPEQATSSAK